MKDEEAIAVRLINADDIKITETEEWEPEHLVATSFTLPALSVDNADLNEPQQILQLDLLRKETYVSFNGSGQVWLAHSEAQAMSLQNNQEQAGSGALFTCPAIVKVIGSAPLWAVAAGTDTDSSIVQSTIAPANPGANSYTYTNNTNVPVSVLAVAFVFTADATVVNRFVNITLKDANGNLLAMALDNTAVTASSILTIHAYQGITQANAASGNVFLPLPQNLVIPPGGTVVLGAINADAGDTVTNITLVVSQNVSSGITVGVLSARRGA